MRSTGGQPDGLYGLAKVDKAETPLRLLLSLPGSSFANPNEMLAKCFENFDGTNIKLKVQMPEKQLKKLLWILMKL